MTHYSELQRYRDAIKALDKSRSKYDTKKSYSSFWMDDRENRFSGIASDVRSTSDTAKLIKLGNYQRAIANFVKIVAKREIPVTFQGDNSFTDGQAVNLTTDIKDNNFDVVVGLALHEGSHIVLSDFELLKEVVAFEKPEVKDILNWIEDRRIDQYIFSTSPGYRAYYHKMYDYYWNDKVITKAMLARKYRTVELDSYMFQIINSLNPAFEANALPGLQEIVDLIDVRNIARLKNTAEALEIAKQVYSIIDRELDKSATTQQQQQPQSGGAGSSSQTGSPSQSQGSPESADSDNSDSKSGQSQVSNSQQGGGSGDDSQDLEDDGSTAQGEDSTEAAPDNAPEEEMPELTAQEEAELRKAVQKQRDFMNGKTGKKSATSKKMVQQIQSILKSGVDMQAINACGKVQNTLIYDYTTKPYGMSYLALVEKRNALEVHDLKGKSDIDNQINNLRSEFGLFTDCFRGRDMYKEAVKKGVELGGLLGRKLLVRNESRTLEHNRLTTGRIDNKRLAHAGYGIDTIFNQIHVDKYKSANLHISLDASGSMGGKNWSNAILMTAAICKAITYTQNVNVQVSFRGTKSSGRGSDDPTIVLVYDSRKNHINQLIAMLANSSTFGTTPEGICFEAMMRKNMIVPTSANVDSYFLNISDGMPEMTGFSGRPAREYTRRQVDALRNNLRVGVMSFFVQEVAGKTTIASDNFREMYGKDSLCVAADNMSDLARAMNSKFLSHGKVSS